MIGLLYRDEAYALISITAPIWRVPTSIYLYRYTKLSESCEQVKIINQTRILNILWCNVTALDDQPPVLSKKQTSENMIHYEDNRGSSMIIRDTVDDVNQVGLSSKTLLNLLEIHEIGQVDTSESKKQNYDQMWYM